MGLGVTRDVRGRHRDPVADPVMADLGRLRLTDCQGLFPQIFFLDLIPPLILALPLFLSPSLLLALQARNDVHPQHAEDEDEHGGGGDGVTDFPQDRPFLDGPQEAEEKSQMKQEKGEPEDRVIRHLSPGDRGDDDADMCYHHGHGEAQGEGVDAQIGPVAAPVRHPGHPQETGGQGPQVAQKHADPHEAGDSRRLPGLDGRVIEQHGYQQGG